MALVKQPSSPDEQIALRVAASIAQQLDDPRAPQICPLCAHDFILLDAINRMIYLSKRSHVFWDAIATFVALQRSDVEIGTLESNLTTMHKKCPLHRTIIKLYNNLGQSLTQIALDTMMRAIFNVLHPEPTSAGAMKRAHSERRSFGNSSGNWPQKPGQLLPYGAEASLQAYICWAADPLNTMGAVLYLLNKPDHPSIGHANSREKLRFEERARLLHDSPSLKPTDTRGLGGVCQQ